MSRTNWSGPDQQLVQTGSGQATHYLYASIGVYKYIRPILDPQGTPSGKSLILLARPRGFEPLLPP